LKNIAPVRAAIEQLVNDSGLEIYNKLDESVSPDERFRKALELTQKRYDSLPESERVLPPSEAIADLAKTLSNAMGMAGTSYGYSILENMPSIEPLAILSPAMGVIRNSIRSIQYSISTHHELLH
jgi:hypothetical protein